MNKKFAIGIDLGTYNSCAAYAGDADHVSILKDRHGPTLQGQLFPSFIRFDNNGDAIEYGEEARMQMTYASELVVWGVKRLIGRSYHQVEKDTKRFAYSILKEKNGDIAIAVGKKQYSPAEISALILKWIKNSAETYNPYITEPISKAVITHPAYFDASQIEQTKEAALHAGFEEIELITEPVAAAIAYGLQLESAGPQFIMTIDWGAGTLDIVIVLLKTGISGKPVLVETKPARGDVALGGIDMDDLLLIKAVETYGLNDYQTLISQTVQPTLSEELQDILGKNIPPELKDLLKDGENAKAFDQKRISIDQSIWNEFCGLRSQLEKLKIELSRVPSAQGPIAYHGKTILLKMARTRNDRLDRGDDWIILEDVLQPLLISFKKQIEFALKKSGLQSTDIQHVLLVGGPMHMPCVRKVIMDIFSNNRAITGELMKIEKEGFPVSPMEAVARGAALFAGHIGPDPTLKRIPFDYGVLFGQQGEILVREGDVVPCEVSYPTGLVGGNKPDGSIPIGLYKREVSPEGEIYTRMGDYVFVATVNKNNKINFQPMLRAGEDKTISLEIKDLISGDSLTLNRLSVLTGMKITKPLRIEVVIDDGSAAKSSGGGGGGSVDHEESHLIDISQKRQAALAAIKIGQYALEHNPAVQTNARLQKELNEKIQKLKQVLPSENSVDQRSYQQLANRCTELIGLMETEKLINEEDKYL